MSVIYQISSDETKSEATLVFSNGDVVVVNSLNNPNYQKIVMLLIQGNPDDDQAIYDLAKPALTVGKALTRLSERVIYDNGSIYFDGDIIDSSITQHIIRIIEEGGQVDAYQSLVNFLEKLYQNPSQESREALYDFLSRYNITIAPDGDFLAYKGVREDGTSIHAGYGIVNGKVYQNDHLPNPVGAVIEMPRSKVNGNRAEGCSVGLHAGAYDYANWFAQGKLLLVKINPRDVVSVPEDSSYQKLRISRYVVLEQTNVEYKKTTYTPTSTYMAHTINLEDKEDFVDEIKETVANGETVTVSFDYTSLSGHSSHVDNFTVTTVETQWDGDVLLTGLNQNNEYRSYKVSGMENETITNSEDENTSTPVPPTQPSVVFPNNDVWAQRIADALKDN